MDTYVGWPGSVHDACVLAMSVVFERERVCGTLAQDKKQHIGGVDVPIVLLGDPACLMVCGSQCSCLMVSWCPVVLFLHSATSALEHLILMGCPLCHCPPPPEDTNACRSRESFCVGTVQ